MLPSVIARIRKDSWQSQNQNQPNVIASKRLKGAKRGNLSWNRGIKKYAFDSVFFKDGLPRSFVSLISLAMTGGESATLIP